MNQFLLTTTANTCPSSQLAGFVNSVVTGKSSNTKATNLGARRARRAVFPGRPLRREKQVRKKASGQAIQPRTFTTTQHLHSMGCRRRGDGRGQRVEERGQRREP